ncbi:hypothetical protein [Oceanobacillus bengalensis]|uniref:Uncharacterized protein n=1 Tax=Oceanobacillus bengalensis TaxID=1435466 RepID=A0A494YT59_9BACI|nr:hypothetical protein [Oceanobacillus bengalensis]RKQ13290.1 hypothetical protein D8M05_16560 [Oceanobacillus bengalensis]
MPNPVDNKAYFIDNLTNYINASNSVIIDDELKEILSNSDDVNDNYDAFKFNIGINGDEEEKDKEG